MNLRQALSPLKSLSIIALTLALSVAIQTHALSTWAPATASAPGGNVPTPINSGLNTQSKLGGLFLNTSNTQPFDIGLSVFGRAIFNGDVQIATGSPAAGKVLTALDNEGNVGWATGTVGGGVSGGCDYTLVRGGDSGNNFVAFTPYHNDTGTALFITASMPSANDTAGSNILGYLSPDGTNWTLVASDGGPAITRGSISMIVPVGYYYRLQGPDYNSQYEHSLPASAARAWKLSCGGSSGSTGGSSGASWVNVPLTDTAVFDQSCEYRFQVNTNGDYASWGGSNPVLYGNGVDPEQLTYISHSGHISHIPRTAKDKYCSDSIYTYVVTKMEKRCGGGSSTTTTTSPSFASGAWCGLWTQYEGSASCQGSDPGTSCPTGFTRKVVHSYQDNGSTVVDTVTCIKN